MKRKGITPVIAVVLLLLITVGAVASAWGLYQQITSNQGQVDQLNARQAAANTQISAQSVYKSTDGYVMTSLRNQGSRAVNLSQDVDLLIAPGSDSDYYSQDLYDRAGLNNVDLSQSNCFSADGSENVLETGSTLDCNTTVPFPSAGETYKFRLSYANVDGYNWDFSCTPTSSDDIRCD